MTKTAEFLRVIEGEGGAHVDPAPEPVDPLVGQVIDGRYQVESVLGEGGMGLVYRARHTVLGKTLAIKVLRPEVSKDIEIMQRFKQEAQSASNIGSEHIIDISDFGTLPDRSTYFVMEFLEGSDLTNVIASQRPLAAARTVHIVKQLCRALGAAHERDIVHRDLKPDNIYLIKRGGDSDFVKVLDFGIAKVSGGASKLTKAGQVFGTPHYMSPEQCAGTSVDQRTDIYALGVILYEMASGRVPFDADNLMGILTKHLYETPIPPRELPPPVDVSPAFEAVILKCLTKSADQRYQTMNELHADLEKVEQGLTPLAVMQAVERSSKPHPSVDAERSSLQPGVGRPRVGRRSKWVPVAIGFSVVAVLGVGAVVAFGGQGAGRGAAEPPAAAAAPAAQEPVPSPAPQPSEPTEVAAAVPARSATVRLESVPAGADVYQDGELIGTTPLELARPEGDLSVAYELRAEGHASKTVRVTALSMDEFQVSLAADPARRTGGRRNPGTSAPAAPATAPAAPSGHAPTPAPSGSEIIDPFR